MRAIFLVAVTPGPSISNVQLLCRNKPPTRTLTVAPRWPPAGKMYEATGASAATNVGSSPIARKGRRNFMRSFQWGRFATGLDFPPFQSLAGWNPAPLPLQQVVDDPAVVDDPNRASFGCVEF